MCVFIIVIESEATTLMAAEKKDVGIKSWDYW